LYKYKKINLKKKNKLFIWLKDKNNYIINEFYSKQLLFLYYMQMLSFNNNKFKNWFLFGLKNILQNIYKKKVELNIVNLKYLFLNSNIFTESIATKLKKRENRLLSVLNKALSLAKLGIYIKYSTYNARFYKKKKNYFNLTRFIISHSTNKKDALNKFLLNNLPLNRNNNYIYSLYVKNNIEKILLNNIKYRSISGIRLEASGRLSKRLIASRSVFKLKYNGSLKNIDSSYKGLSSPMKRGYQKSNLQYTKINSITRNGAFGLKGWISSH
jgi:hypothetical protein